jgi:hypothetical protein
VHTGFFGGWRFEVCEPIFSSSRVQRYPQFNNKLAARLTSLEIRLTTFDRRNQRLSL